MGYPAWTVTTTQPDRVPSKGPGAVTDTHVEGPTGKRATRLSPRWRRVVEWGLVILLAFGAAVGIRALLIQAFYIPSGSMLPTLQLGDRIIVDKLSYHLHPINRGDIVVFSTPPADRGDPSVQDLVKRVIGLPGETIATDGAGRVTIDGRALSEPYLPRGTVTSSPPLRPQTIPKGEYFVMGDNRSDSKDSRIFGPIRGSLVVGRAVMRIWPLSHISLL